MAYSLAVSKSVQFFVHGIRRATRQIFIPFAGS
jgi:hypothetical protein